MSKVPNFSVTALGPFEETFCEVVHQNVSELTGDLVPNRYTAVAFVLLPDHLCLQPHCCEEGDVLSWAWTNTQNHACKTGSWRDNPLVKHSVEFRIWGKLWSRSTDVGDRIRFSDGRWYEVTGRGFKAITPGHPDKLTRGKLHRANIEPYRCIHRWEDEEIPESSGWHEIGICPYGGE